MLVEDKIEELLANGAEIDGQGRVVLYHRTSPAAAGQIRATGVMIPREDGIFFSTRPDGAASGYGSEVLRFKIPVRLVEIDDVFGDEAHVRLPARAHRANSVGKYLDVPRRNPAPAKSRPSPRAVKLYEQFHQFEPVDIGTFPGGFRIPSEAVLAGDAEYVLYRSDKLNPTTGEDEGDIDYIHEHKDGVRVYRTDANFSGPVRKVPKWIRSARELVRLGECLGFGYVDADGYEVEATVKQPRPELYTIPSGKALLVIEDRRRVVALIWGGKLGVEARGIVN